MIITILLFGFYYFHVYIRILKPKENHTKQYELESIMVELKLIDFKIKLKNFLKSRGTWNFSIILVIISVLEGGLF